MRSNWVGIVSQLKWWAAGKFEFEYCSRWSRFMFRLYFGNGDLWRQIFISEKLSFQFEIVLPYVFFKLIFALADPTIIANGMRIVGNDRQKRVEQCNPENTKGAFVMGQQFSAISHNWLRTSKIHTQSTQAPVQQCEIKHQNNTENRGNKNH